MGEKNKKNSSLTIRIECKTKNNLKKIAKNKDLTMSELVNEYLVDMVEREKFKKSNENQLEKRYNSFEEKIQKLKEKMKW